LHKCLFTFLRAVKCFPQNFEEREALVDGLEDESV
jgi:hypothetical protein